MNHLANPTEKSEATQSYLNRIATWYAKLPLWTNITLGLSSAALGACGGILFNTVLFGAISGAVLYAFLFSVFFQHYRGTQLDRAVLKRQFDKQEQELKKSVEEFEAAKVPMNQLIGTLAMQTFQQEQQIQQFKSTIEQLTVQSTALEESQQSLKKNECALAQHNEKLAQQTQQLSLITTELSKQQHDIARSGEKISETQRVLQLQSNTLFSTNNHLVTSTQQISQLGQQFSTLQALINHIHKGIVANSSPAKNAVDKAFETELEQQETGAALRAKTMQNIRAMFPQPIASSTERNSQFCVP